MYSKMILNIAICFTILLIIGEYRGAQSEHDVLDEFNLMCYVSMYAFLLDVLNDSKYSRQHEGYVKSSLLDIRRVNTKLHRVNSWTKFLNGLPEDIYSETIYAINNYNEEVAIEIVKRKLESIYNGSHFINIIWTSLKVLQFFNALISGQERESLINTTFTFCKNSLFLLSEPTENIENNIIATFYDNNTQSQPFGSSINGSVLLLMTEAKIDHFLQTENEYKQKIIVIDFVIEVVEDIYRGVNNILQTINTSYLKNDEFKRDFRLEYFDIKLLRMLMQTFYSVVELTSQLNDLMQIIGVKLLLSLVTSNRNQTIGYNEFRTKFFALWQNKFGSEYYLRAGQPLLTLSDGPLIKNNIVIPSIISYYTVCDELWKGSDHLNFIDRRVVFLMELNAWISILKEQLNGINEYLIRIDCNVVTNKFLDLSADKAFIMSFEHFFQTES